MTASDFGLSDGGRRQITVKPATTPLRVALIVSDAGRGWFQIDAIRLCEALVEHGEISITALVQDFETLTDYTQDVDLIRDGLARLGKSVVNFGPAPVRLIETIVRVARGIRRDGYRTAIVVMRGSSEARPAFGAEEALDAIRQSGAALYVVGPVFAGALETLPAAMVLETGSRESGGRQIRTAAEVPGIATELINQYEITYTLPSGMTPSDRVSVTSIRTGVAVQAPSRVAK